MGTPYKPPTSPNLLPAYSEAGKHRVKLNLHQEQLLQKYVRPELRVVKTPWEAALETGSASTAFIEATPTGNQQLNIAAAEKLPALFAQQESTLSITPIPRFQEQLHRTPTPHQQPKPYQQPLQPQQPQQAENLYESHFKLPKSNQQHIQKSCSNYQRDLAYKPSVPQGWKSSSVNLPSANELEINGNELAKTQELCEEFIRQVEADLEADLQETNLLDLNEERLEQCHDNKNKLSEHCYQHRPEFMDHLLRSPELRMSPIRYKHINAYDKTVRQLYYKQQKLQHKHLQEINEDIIEKFDLRKELSEVMDSKENQKKVVEADKDDEQYVKIAVGDLINVFEQQTLQQLQPNVTTKKYIQEHHTESTGKKRLK